MTRPSTILRSVAALSLIVTMFAAFAVTGSAQVVNPDTFPDFFTQDTNECYFASVSNGEDFGLGASQTSITVQNLSGELGTVYIMVGTGDGFDDAEFANLSPGASKTFTAAGLGIADGATAPVVVAGYDFASSQSGDFTPEDGITIGCVAKQAVAGGSLPYTTAADTSVSGYNATSGREVGFFDQLYLPIVQTNCGPGGCWNTVLRVANVGPFDNAAVTVRFFPAENAAGSLDTGFQLEGLLDQGELWSINLMDYVPEGWVGSAHIFTDDSVVAIADRYKAGTDMWITNTAANQTAESTLQVPGGPANAPYVLYAPDVRLDYNGWNTGISVANTVDGDNNVSIQYFGNSGNAPQAQSQRLAAHGMTYFYNPSAPSEDECEQPADQVPTCDFVGAAIILSDFPVAAAIDGVKYFGNDANVGQAFSYSATGNVFQLQAAPLVQKGSPATGMGATSGINFLNPNAGSTYITVNWVNPSGFDASNFGDSVVWVPGFATGFVYTMTQHNLPNGFSGSAVVASQLPIAASSANVDYQVQGDGTAIWTLYNPCGFYRQLGDCEFVLPIETATKVLDTNVADALVCVYAVGDAGQDGKPELPTDCELLAAGVKGDGGGGQGAASTYFADLGDEGDVAAVTFNEDTNELDVAADVNGDGTPGVLYNVSITYDTDFDVDLGKDVPSGENSVCPASGVFDTAFLGNEELFLGTAAADVDGDVSFDFSGTLTGDTVQEIGDFENAAFVVYDGVTGDIVGCGQIESGTVEIESFADAAVRLGAEGVGMTDADGDFEVTLPLGDYVAIISADGYTSATEAFTLDEAGETEVNEVNLDAVVGPGPVETGTLVKGLIIPDFALVDGILAGDLSLNTEVLFCTSPVATADDCDEAIDPAAVVHGGFDTYVDPDNAFFDDLDDTLQQFGVFMISADVPVGDYTICMGVSLVGDFDLTFDADGDGTVDNDVQTLDAGFNCEDESNLQIVGTDITDFDLATGPITVTADAYTIVVNVMSSLDVFVQASDLVAPDNMLVGAEVCLYDDSAMTELIGCTLTDDAGIARFFFVGDLLDDTTFTSNANGMPVLYEQEATTFEYNIIDDIINGGPFDDAATADSIQSLDPQ